MWRSGALSVLLLVLVVMGALSVVTSQHKARKLFVALQQEKELAHKMEVEWGQLQLEQSTLATPARVERIASRQLQMQLPKQIRFIRVSQPSPQSYGGAVGHLAKPINDNGADGQP